MGYNDVSDDGIISNSIINKLFLKRIKEYLEDLEHEVTNGFGFEEGRDQRLGKSMEERINKLKDEENKND